MRLDQNGKVNANVVALTTAIITLVLVAAFIMPVMAQNQQESADPLYCVDFTKEEIRDEINNNNIRKINEGIRENSDKIPNSVRNAMVGERTNIKVESTYFSTVINENARVERIEAHRLDNPTMRVTTDCQTVKDILESENQEAALRSAIDRGGISWEGVTTSSEIETSYGGKAVQTYTIVNSGETGNAQDAAEGFSSGLTL